MTAQEAGWLVTVMSQPLPATARAANLSGRKCAGHRGGCRSPRIRRVRPIAASTAPTQASARLWSSGLPHCVLDDLGPGRFPDTGPTQGGCAVHLETAWHPMGRHPGRLAEEAGPSHEGKQTRSSCATAYPARESRLYLGEVHGEDDQGTACQKLHRRAASLR